MAKFTGITKVPKLENGKSNRNIGTEYDSDSNYYTFKLWVKQDKKRIYINDYKGRGCGYIDLTRNNEIMTENKYVEETAKYFLSNYEVGC